MKQTQGHKRKNKSFQIITLIGLLLFFLLMGGVLLPYWHTHTFHDKNPPPKPFPIAIRAFDDQTVPYITLYDDFDFKGSSERVWEQNARFPHQHFDAELNVAHNHVYELKFKTTHYQAIYRYRFDENNQKIIPLSHKLTGRFIWIDALIYSVVVAVLVTLAQWLRLKWKTKQPEKHHFEKRKTK